MAAKKGGATAEERKAEWEAVKAEKAAEKAAEKEAAKQAKQAAKEQAKAELEQRQRFAAAQQQALLKEAAAAAATRRQPSATCEANGAPPVGSSQGTELLPRQPLDDVSEVSIGKLIEMLLESQSVALGVARSPSERLGLPPGAPRDACRKRYLVLALRLHPDKASHPKAGEAFKALEEVFQMCTNDRERYKA